MTVERSMIVAVPRTPTVAELVRDIVSAAERAEKAEPGDRVDVIRYESLCARLEALAERALDDGAERLSMPELLPDATGYCFDDSHVVEDKARLKDRLPDEIARTVAAWRSATVVELRRPLEVGATQLTEAHAAVPEPAEPWQAEGDVTRSRAVEQRFRSQLEVAVAGGTASRARSDAINPSGINNRILTQTLYEFVGGTSTMRVDVPVTYRDGSEASNTFPLRCLPLAERPPAQPDLELHLALLSIRHTEMDPVVDGAWLRNAEVSRPRPAALTDDFVYETSRTQLDHLTDGGRLTAVLHMYQTGLDTAVVGFYRAVVDHLLDYPYSVTIVPMFFSSRSGGAGREQEAPFLPGAPWTMGERA